MPHRAMGWEKISCGIGVRVSGLAMKLHREDLRDPQEMGMDKQRKGAQVFWCQAGAETDSIRRCHAVF